MKRTSAPELSIDGHSLARSAEAHASQDDATRVALYLAAQIQKEHLELYRQRAASGIDPVTFFVYQKIKEFIWTAARLVGFAHLHDGTRKRIPKPRHPPIPRDGDDSARAILDASPRLFIDVTPTFRFGRNQGVQRVVREIAKRSIRFGALPVVIEDKRVVPYFRPSRPCSPIELRKGDKFIIFDASWMIADEYAPIVEALSEVGGQLVTLVYDIIPLVQPLSVAAPVTEQFRTWLEAIVLKSDRVLCISRSVADDLVSYLLRGGMQAKPELRVGWWRLGADFEQSEEAISPAALRATSGKAPFFLSVGTLEPRKAYPVALDAFDLLWRSGAVDARYVILGRAGWQSEALQRDIRKHPEYGRRLFWLNDASDADLFHCYERARALIFPSALEGFGLPLVEARRRGIPVIASDIPVFHEIGGDNVRYFDLLDSVGLADEILRAFREGPTRRASIPVSWDEAAQALLELVATDSYQMRLDARAHNVMSPLAPEKRRASR